MRSLGLLLALVLAGPLPAEVTTPAGYPDAETFIYRAASPEPVRLHVVKPDDWQPGDQRVAWLRFFGGGWRRGTPDNAIGTARSAAKLGLVGIAPDYRVTERWPASDATLSVADARFALRWVQEHADQLGIDPRRVIVSGGSAGAHLALWTAIAPTPPGLDDGEAPLFPPAALILSSPPSDTTLATGFGGDRFHSEQPDAFSPSRYADQPLPPILLFHGDADTIVPFGQSVAFDAALRAAGNACEFHPVPGGGHNFTGDVPEWKDKVARLQRDFLTRLGLLPSAR